MEESDDDASDHDHDAADSNSIVEENDADEIVEIDAEESVFAQSRAAAAEEAARARVRRQLGDQKRRMAKKEPLDCATATKTYVKGKHLMNYVGYQSKQTCCE